MRIGILASSGAHLDSFFPDIGALLTERSHQVHFAAGTPAATVRVTTLSAITQRPRPVNARAPRQIREWVGAERLDVVLTNMATGSALARVRDVGAPVVYFAHGLHWNDPPSRTDLPWRVIELVLLRRSAALIVLNQEDADWVRQHSDLPCQLLPYGVGLRPDRYPRSPRPDHRTMVWIGELSQRKRPELALRVAQRLAEEGEDFHLTMLGEGARLDEIRELASTPTLRTRVSLPGFGDAAAHLTESRLLLHTATWEGLPRVMLEAMSVGRPTAAFDVKGVRRLPSVHLAPDKDVGALARTARALLNDPGHAPDFPDPALLDVRRSVGLIEDLLHKVA